MRDAQKLIEFAEHAARMLFAAQGRIYPMYHYITRDHEHRFMIPEPRWSKDEYALHARAAMGRDGAVACLFIAEAWTLKVGVADKQEALARYAAGLENDPDRLEVVTLQAEDEQGTGHGTMVIHRPADRPPYLGELEVEWPDMVEGRMVGMLPTPQRRN